MIKIDVVVSILEGYVGLLISCSGVSSKIYLVIEIGKIDVGYYGNLGINIKNDEECDGIFFLYDDIDVELEDGLISILDIKGNYV